MKPIFTNDELDLLARKVRRVLKSLGYCVRHDRLSEFLTRKGLKTSPSGRFRFDDRLIDEFVAWQSRRTRPGQAETWTRGQPFRRSFGNICPKYYDYAAQSAVSARTKHLIDLVKFAHQEPKIESVILPVAVVDVPAPTAPIESFLHMMRLTNKFSYWLDPYGDELVKYLVELSAVFLGDGQADRFVDPCDCINPILRLEDRTAGVMMERAKYNLHSLVTSMPTAGGTAPVTIDGAVIQGTAEIVGGLVIAWLLNPDAAHVGYISSSVMDFASGNITQSSPETVLIDCGVIQLMDHGFGGNTRYGGASFISARRPGLQAVFEKMFKAAAYHRITGTFWYAGNGNLDNGSLLSPEQLLIDLDIAESFHHVQPQQVETEPIEDLIAQMAETEASEFLTTDHTLARFRAAFWQPALFTRGDTRSESQILEIAHQRFRDTVNQYQGYDGAPTRIKAVETILARAKNELL